MKQFEIEKLEMLKRMEELLRLNDILVGEKRIYDDSGKKLNTLEVFRILSPTEEGTGEMGLEGKKKIRVTDIIANLSKRFLKKKDVEVQTENREGRPLYKQNYFVISLSSDFHRFKESLRVSDLILNIVHKSDVQSFSVNKKESKYINDIITASNETECADSNRRRWHRLPKARVRSRVQTGHVQPH